MPQATCWASVTTTDAAGAGWPQQPARIWQAAGEVSPCGLSCLGGGGELFRGKSRPPLPESADGFARFPAHVFPIVRRCFPISAQMFSRLCAHILLPTVMGYTTHNYGSYDSQLWVVRPTVVGSRISARDGENLCAQNGKPARAKGQTFAKTAMWRLQPYKITVSLQAAGGGCGRQTANPGLPRPGQS